MEIDPITVPAGSRSATRATANYEGASFKRKKTIDAFAGPSHVLFSAFAPRSLPPPATSSVSSSTSTSTSTSTSISAPALGVSLPAKTSATRENRQRCLRSIDPRLEQDYIYKRKRAYDSADWSSSAVGSSSSSQTVTVTVTTTATTAPWEGVSKVERELVGCCESLEDDFFGNDSDQDTDDDGEEDETDHTGGLVSASSLALLSPMDPIGGVLAIEKEIRFAATLSTGCHTMASRSLALAILERTLEVYLAEEAKSALLLEQQQHKSKDNENQNEEKEDSADESSHNTTDGTTAPSRQSLRYQNRVKRQRLLADEDGQNVSDDTTNTTANVDDSLEISSSSSFPAVAAAVAASSSSSSSSSSCSVTGEHPRNRRFDHFFGAGGLRILNQWLVDASSYDTTKAKTTSLTTSTATTSASSTKGKSNNTNKNSTMATTTTQHVIRRAHATRPIVLSILRFLEHIPFEKKTVKNSTINKQIQKLGKKVALIQEAHQAGQAPEEDLNHWIVARKPPIGHDVALTQILEAVDAVKVSWREKAKAKREKHQTNPFGALQSKIKERLQDWTKFESGAVSTRPEWYRSPRTAAAASEAFQKTSSQSPLPLKRKAAPPTEAELEKLNLQKKIKQVQSRSQKSLQQLREKLRQRQAGTSTHSSSAADIGGPRNSKVAWKDGMKSQATRNRQLLEEVFVFGKELPSSTVGPEKHLFS